MVKSIDVVTSYIFVCIEELNSEGDRLQHDTGVHGHCEKAFLCYQESATMRNDVGQLRLGMCYARGTGTSTDMVKAHDYFQLSADQNNCHALCCLFQCLIRGDGVAVNKEKAFNVATKLANLGHVEGIYRVGLCFLFGYGGVVDTTRAMSFLMQAASRRHSTAPKILARLYYEGIVVKKDVVKACHWLRRAAEGGDAQSQYLLGLIYLEGFPDDIKRIEAYAIQCLSKAASSGHSHGMYHFGSCLLHGRGIQRDTRRGAHLILAAAREGVSKAIATWHKNSACLTDLLGLGNKRKCP